MVEVICCGKRPTYLRIDTNYHEHPFIDAEKTKIVFECKLCGHLMIFFDEEPGAIWRRDLFLRQEYPRIEGEKSGNQC